ncbi:CDP-glycerol glycerophosphotransferase family protein [Paenibacillus rubinfantis]|uniref:CDP-glycerol glycerophosphotransferase family protein n=1 Tax=Paenibacillus rubinfantis TaxID=1720296 RepID=UPI00073E526D|nr:CDP-glycerol glycerophosphotransferase family protein [Paenibacillus rubinfantis]
MENQDKIKITLFHLSSSGSNNYYLYRAASDELRTKYDIELLTEEQFRHNRYIDQSDVYITTHGEYLSPYDKINIDLWHGFPLKGMAKMDKQEQVPDEHIQQHWAKMDMIMSYSPLYNTAMNACNGANIRQYRVTGVPRNDALFSNGSKANLNTLYPQLDVVKEKFIFFMPTFRKSVMTPNKVEGSKNSKNLFGLPAFEQKELLKFLEENQITLIIKLHPFEEAYFAEELEQLKSPKILVLNDGMLGQANLDLYDVLSAADMLITDYSSVYIDYLLLNRPIVFLPTDLEEYKGNRGLLFEPYDFWTPGPKVYTQKELQGTIYNLISGQDSYSDKRQTILNLCHTYQDNKASKRIWGMIDEYIQENLNLIYERRQLLQTHKRMQQQIKQKINEMIEQGHLAQANEAINQYLETNTADSDIFAMNGMLHLLTDNPHEAIKTFERGYQFFPWDEDLLYNLGYVYESLGERESALHNYVQARKQTMKPQLIALLDERIAALSVK